MRDDGYFDERVAASYDRPDGEEFDPAAIETIVDFLVERAEPDGRSSLASARAASRSRSPGAGCRCTGSTSRRR
jgi:hypothetical protein